MLTGFRVLWRALIHFWDESLLLIRANVTWFVISLPLYLLTVFAAVAVILFVQTLWPGAGPDGMPTDTPAATSTGAAEDGSPEDSLSFLPWVLAALVLVVVPSPTSAGVYAIANHVANEETPEFSIFWRAIKMLWKPTLIMYLIGCGVFAGLLLNINFYVGTPGLLAAVAILWLYGLVYWLTLQAYLMPLLVAAAMPPPPQASGDDGWPLDESRQRPAAAPPPPPEPEILSLRTVYKRAAILALANPLMSLVLLFGVFVALALSSFALPVYPLIVMSLVALVNCRGLRALREKYFPTEAQGAAG